jgi:hypothetical protein
MILVEEGPIVSSSVYTYPRFPLGCHLSAGNKQASAVGKSPTCCLQKPERRHPGPPRMWLSYDFGRVPEKLLGFHW